MLPWQEETSQASQLSEEGAVEWRGLPTSALLNREAEQERAKAWMQICRAGRSGEPQAYVQLLEMWCLGQADIVAASKAHLLLRRES